RSRRERADRLQRHELGVRADHAWADDRQRQARTAVRGETLAARVRSAGERDRVDQLVGDDLRRRLAPTTGERLFDRAYRVLEAGLREQAVVARKEPGVETDRGPHRLARDGDAIGHGARNERRDVDRRRSAPREPGAERDVLAGA